MKLLIATHNKHKVIEFTRILAPLGIEVVTAEMVGKTISEAEETADSFAGNAEIKAESACRETGLPAIADDSGLCVDALNGAPGIYSARYAEPGHRKERVLKELEGVPAERRGAHFTCAICCVFPNGDKLTAEESCYGTIGYECRGENGFGYDPIFMFPDGRSSGEYSDEEKDAVSHRGKALRAFKKTLMQYLAEKGECSNDQ